MEKTKQELIEEAKLLAEQGQIDEATSLLERIKTMTEEDEPQEEREQEVLEEEAAEVLEDEEAEKTIEKEKEEMKELGINLENEEIRSFEQFIKTKGVEKREGLTTVEGGALIPKKVPTSPQEAKEVVTDLRKLVNKVSVATGSGSYPVLKANGNVMVSTAELAKNPKLANPEFEDVDYKIATYRGYIPVSQELIDDADYNVAGLVSKHIERQSLNTANAQIAKALQSFKALTVEDLDGIKEILNVKLNPAYNAKFVMSQSMFNAVDVMKDADGRYLLSQDITVASGYKLFGREVVILEDTVVGKKAGDLVAFIGDLDAGVAFFDRKQASVKWVDNDVYGQLLAGFIRFDAKKADAEAGFYVTLKPAVVVGE